MQFVPIASSSEGNCFIVKGDNSSILLECGIKFREIQKALNFQLSNVDACLITHEHKDHSRSIKDVLRAGVTTYTTKGTAQAIGIKHHRLKHLEARVQFQVGEFTILPFEVEHDANDPVGFIIGNSKGEKLLFATDTYFIRYRFNGLTTLAVECNYSEDILKQNILDGITPLAMKKRLQQSHFSLENFKEFIKANDISGVKEIWLLHLSSRNADSERFRKEIRALTGKPVYIA